MAYSTKSDVLEVVPADMLAQLTNDSGVNSVVDAVVTAAIAKADNQINSYLRGKSASLPLSPVPARVKDWSVGLAIFNLYSRRINLKIPEYAKTDHDDIISELKGVRDGKILIDDSTSVANLGTIIKTNKTATSVNFNTNTSKNGQLDRFWNGCI